MLNGHDVSWGPYKISSSPGISLPFERYPRTLRFSQLFCWTVWVCYCISQAVFILNLNDPPRSLQICLWTCMFAEVCLTFTDITIALDFIIHSFRQGAEGPRPTYRLLNDSVPHVDVFVTCCGEPIDILINTIRSAATQDYPSSKHNVVVLDDGHDENLEIAVDQLNCEKKGMAKIFYRSRKVEPGTRSFFKAGNLNYGITQTAQISGGEYMASIDADIIVSPNWLRNMLPHLILDPEVGLATCPQNYYHVPSDDRLAQQIEFDIWNTIFEPLHDRVGAAMCMGSGFVVRRRALDDIGGWPLAETGEDYMCSTKLVENGWKVVLVRENLQHGISPSSFDSFKKQKLRWIDAAVEVHTSNGWYMSQKADRGISFLDQSSSILFALRDLSSISTSLSLILLPISILSLVLMYPEISVSASQYTLIRFTTMMTFVAGRVNDWIVYKDVGITGLYNFRALEIWFAPYAAARCLQLLLPFRSNVANFFVTGSYLGGIKERSPSQRAPLLQRLQSSGLSLHVCYVMACSAVLVCSAFLRPARTPTESGLVATMALMPGHAVKLAACTWKASVLLWYMVSPPEDAGWQRLVEKDSKDVFRPKKPFPMMVNPSGSGLGSGHTRLWQDALEVLILCLCL